MNWLFTINTSTIEIDMLANPQRWENYLPIVVRKKIMRTRNPLLRKNRLIVWGFLYRYAEAQGWSFNVHLTRTGKPYTEDPFFFNYSHSGHWIALGISTHELGVDLETKKLPNQSWIEEKIRRMGLSWQSSVEKESVHYMSSLWSAYESRIKYEGLNTWSTHSLEEIPIRQNISEDYILTYCGWEVLELNHLNMRREGHDIYLCDTKRNSIFRL